jgi:8-oxo-dGTP pyrophosphatase MutT (NUDIX family)
MCMFAYRHFPIFGDLPGALAIVRKDDKYVLVQRNDGLGLCFPGGLVGFRETPENAVRREVKEETGLTVEAAELKFQYRVDLYYPSVTTVFDVTSQGEIKHSWEGKVVVTSLEGIREKVIPTQRIVVDYLNSSAPQPLAG